MHVKFPKNKNNFVTFKKIPIETRQLSKFSKNVCTCSHSQKKVNKCFIIVFIVFTKGI